MNDYSEFISRQVKNHYYYTWLDSASVMISSDLWPQRKCNGPPCDGPGFDSWCQIRASRPSQGTVNGGAISKLPRCPWDLKHNQPTNWPQQSRRTASRRCVTSCAAWDDTAGQIFCCSPQTCRSGRAPGHALARGNPCTSMIWTSCYSLPQGICNKVHEQGYSKCQAMNHNIHFLTWM